MWNPELYHRTVKVLEDALAGITLEFGNPYACAGGNIVAAANGIKVVHKLNNPRGRTLLGTTNYLIWEGYSPIKKGQENIPNWARAVVGLSYEDGDPLIENTGYLPKQIEAISFAFECNDEGKTMQERLRNGVDAAIRVLKQIHQMD